MPRAFIRCTGDIDPTDPSTDLLGPFAARAKAEGWVYREMPTKHDPHWFNPECTARVIHELASCFAKARSAEIAG